MPKRGIRCLGFESPTPTWPSERSGFPRPRALSAHPGWDVEDSYYSSVAFDDIETVTPSRLQIGGVSGITGLLFQHANAHTSCVGQVRLDSLGSPFEVGNSQELWLGFGSPSMGGPCVIQAPASPPPDEENAPELTWLALPCRGLLEWWLSFRQCKIHHESRESPATSDEVPADYPV